MENFAGCWNVIFKSRYPVLAWLRFGNGSHYFERNFGWNKATQVKPVDLGGTMGLRTH